jgi:hypothetical protein
MRAQQHEQLVDTAHGAPPLARCRRLLSHHKHTRKSRHALATRAHLLSVGFDGERARNEIDVVQEVRLNEVGQRVLQSSARVKHVCDRVGTCMRVPHAPQHVRHCPRIRIRAASCACAYRRAADSRRRRAATADSCRPVRATSDASSCAHCRRHHQLATLCACDHHTTLTTTHLHPALPYAIVYVIGVTYEHNKSETYCAFDRSSHTRILHTHAQLTVTRTVVSRHTHTREAIVSHERAQRHCRRPTAASTARTLSVTRTHARTHH